MGRRILCLVLLSVCMAAGQTMDIHLRDGTTDKVGLDDIQKLTFDMAAPQSLVVHLTAGGTSSTPMSTIRKITFDLTTGNRRDARKVARLKTALMSILPNPVSHVAAVTFSLAQRGRVVIEVYNSRGELVRTVENDRRGAGVHRVVWDARTDKGTRVVSGTYLMRVTIDDKTAVRRLTMVR